MSWASQLKDVNFLLARENSSLQKELDETKAVLGDLLQEKMPEVFLVSNVPFEDGDGLIGVFTDLAKAKAAAQAHRGVEPQVWDEFTPFDGHYSWSWLLRAGTYTISSVGVNMRKTNTSPATWVEQP